MRNSPSDCRVNDWQGSTIAADGTHHIDENTKQPLYKIRFDTILPFHSPGLAAVCAGNRFFHICPDGAPAYSSRFDRAFGFYDSLATVVTGRNWFHIHPDGTKAYGEAWDWCGNFQQNRCVVRNGKDTSDGKRYLTTEPFYNGQALVKTLDGETMVVNEAGETTVKINNPDKKRLTGF